MNPIALRLLNQQLCCQQYATPEEVVDYMGAIQAQDYRMMRWAVAMRTRKPSLQAFKNAYDKGSIIRLHLMRGTWQLLTEQNYWAFLQLCAPKAAAATKGWMKSNKVVISDEESMKVREILSETASSKAGGATNDDFAEALAANGMVMDSHRLSFHLRMSEYDGVLCSGELQPMKVTYSLVEERLPHKEFVDRDEALARLAKLYFRSRQPATLEDFLWWSGLTMNDFRKAAEMLGDYIHTEKYQGREFYLTDDCRTRGVRKGKYLLVAPYDEYLISYKSRDLVLEPELRHHAHNNSGIFQPIILKDGEVCGNWSPHKDACNPRFFKGEHISALEEEHRIYKLYKQR